MEGFQLEGGELAGMAVGGKELLVALPAWLQVEQNGSRMFWP